MLDPWSVRLRKRFPTFTEPAFFQILWTVAKFMPVDVSHIESLHATVRRLLFTRSVQTHRMKFGDLSAQWVCQQFRRSGRLGRRPKKQDEEKAAASPEQEGAACWQEGSEARGAKGCAEKGLRRSLASLGADRKSAPWSLPDSSSKSLPHSQSRQDSRVCACGSGGDSSNGGCQEQRRSWLRREALEDPQGHQGCSIDAALEGTAGRGP